MFVTFVVNKRLNQLLIVAMAYFHIVINQFGVKKGNEFVKHRNVF